MNIDTIVSLQSKKGCQKAVNDLDAVNPEVFEESAENQPKGCYMYTPKNELYFNTHPNGLARKDWSDDTRQVCRDFELAMKKSGGTIILEIIMCKQFSRFLYIYIYIYIV